MITAPRDSAACSEKKIVLLSQFLFDDPNKIHQPYGIGVAQIEDITGDRSFNGTNGAADNVVDVGEIPSHLSIIVDLDRPLFQDRVGKKKKGHGRDEGHVGRTVWRSQRVDNAGRASTKILGERGWIINHLSGLKDCPVSDSEPPEVWASKPVENWLTFKFRFQLGHFSTFSPASLIGSQNFLFASSVHILMAISPPCQFGHFL